MNTSLIFKANNKMIENNVANVKVWLLSNKAKVGGFELLAGGKYMKRCATKYERRKFI